MYGYLKQRKSEGKLLKTEETKLACINEKIKKLYDSYNIRMIKTTEKETKKQVQQRIRTLSIEQKTKLLSLLDTVEEAITENPETLYEELEEV